MKGKKGVLRRAQPPPKMVEQEEEEDDEQDNQSSIPNFDEFLESLDGEDVASGSDDEDVEHEEDEDSSGNENGVCGSSDEELTAALESDGDEDGTELEEEEGDLSEDIEFEEEEESNAKSKVKKKKTKYEEDNCEMRPFHEESDEDAGDTEESHKAALQGLEQSDPEFFAYLRDNDAQLLDFADEDGEDTSDEDEEIDGEDHHSSGKGLHKPPATLEVASDSEAEEELLDEEPKQVKAKVDKFLKKGIVNLYVIAEWEEQLTTTKDLSVLTNVIDAFGSAVQAVLKEDTSTKPKWKVEGSSHFNALVRLCIRHLKGFCLRFLLGTNNQAFAETQFDKNPFDSKEKYKSKWTKLRPKIKLYMSSLIEFLNSMGNPEAIAAVLKHCQKMSGFFAIMATKSYKLLTVLIRTWATGEESCRVLAFMCIIRMANYNKNISLTRTFKQMYMQYVANCKFTSLNTWPCINFMRNSLAEVYLLDTELSYSVAFPFIRQLAIHLRNAFTAGENQNANQTKKEASKIVYSWQFVHSIHLWCDLLAQSLRNGDEKLKLLVYPVVQICLGTIKLIPTRKFTPLRFHIVRMLINLQDKSKIFIPILPLATEVLHLTDFSSKTAGKFSVRPLDLMCCLKADPAETGYFKAITEAIFDTILGACKACATELAFPEIVCPTLIQLKSFLKHKCKNADVFKKFKTLVDKIEANSTYIKTKRAKAMEDGQVTLRDTQSHRVLQAQMMVDTPGPPLLAYADQYFKTNARVTAKARKINTDTREEKRIPKPSAAKTKAEAKSKNTVKNNLGSGASLFSKFGSDDSDEDSTFKTKLELDEGEDDNNVKQAKKKRKSASGGEDESENKPKKKKKQPTQKRLAALHTSFPDDVDDELVDLELSD